jgi:hypothetical protein
MKQMILVALACLNAALLVALVFNAGAPTGETAEAQIVGGGADYLVMTGAVAQNYDALYVLDLSSRQLAAWKFDKKDNLLKLIGRRSLLRDFGRKQPGI